MCVDPRSVQRSKSESGKRCEREHVSQLSRCYNLNLSVFPSPLRLLCCACKQLAFIAENRGVENEGGLFFGSHAGSR